MTHGDRVTVAAAAAAAGKGGQAKMGMDFSGVSSGEVASGLTDNFKDM
jgi:hypothetical protein